MNSDILLHRQVHPSFVINKNDISSQVFEVASSTFMPTPKDENKLSVYNGEKYSPKEAFDHFTETYESFGVLSVSKNECENENLGVVEDNDPFDGHTFIDFSSCTSNNQVKKKAKKLKKVALDRGWMHLGQN